jgi:thiol-disulfide isomerase/thioredoxin
LVIRFVRDPDPAPELKAKDVNGKELSLEAYQGKVVLLNFWAAWCGPCRAEIPSLIRIQEAYKNRLQIIGMDVDDDDEEGLSVETLIELIAWRFEWGHEPRPLAPSSWWIT